MYAAWLRRYKNGKPKPTISGVREDDEHGKPVWAYVRKWRKGPFEFWNVVEVQPHSTSNPNAHRHPADNRSNWNAAGEIDPSVDGEWVEGYVCHNNKNIGRKHDERVFFNRPRTTPDRFLLNGDQWKKLKRDWKDLIEDYAAADHRGLESRPSRHIAEANTEKELKEGTLCYARVVRENGPAHAAMTRTRPGTTPIATLTNGKDSWILFELNPVMISRRLYSDEPLELVPETLRPSVLASTLSPADRVFGWVRQQKGESKEGAYRGQVRIGTVDCTDSKITQFDSNDEKLGLPLAILGQPKPQQGRFYVAADKQGNAQTRVSTNEEAGYNRNDKGLRGRKVYPHYAKLPGDYWIESNQFAAETANSQSDLSQEALANNQTTFFREYIRPKSDKRRDNQNRSVRAWVEKGATFEFDINFINLSHVELGALVWLLTLNESQNKGNGDQPRFFRLGGGKPLGFGSVTLKMKSCDIRDGVAWRKFYKSLSCNEGQSAKVERRFLAEQTKTDSSERVYRNDGDGLDQLIRAYKAAVRASYQVQLFDDVSFIRAFLKAATGFDTGLPCHYPRARRCELRNGGRFKPDTSQPFDPTAEVPPHQDGLAYEWFVENNKPGRGLTLDNLWQDKGLPIHKHEFRSPHQGGQQHGRGQSGRNRGRGRR